MFPRRGTSGSRGSYGPCRSSIYRSDVQGMTPRLNCYVNCLGMMFTGLAPFLTLDPTRDPQDRRRRTLGREVKIQRGA